MPNQALIRPRKVEAILPKKTLLVSLFIGFCVGSQSLLIAQVVANSDRVGNVDQLVQWAWPAEDIKAAGEAFWPQYRGINGDGRADKSNPPVHWSEKENILWKTAIAGRGWSSPMVWGDDIWITSATDDGTQQSVLCLNRRDGKIRIERVVFKNEKVQPDHHATNSYASPSPVLDGQRAYVHFGAYGTAAIDSKTGATVWERRDLPCNHFRGPGSSPILFGNLLIFQMDGYDFNYAVALDKRTGETVWKRDRDIAYGTNDGDLHKAFGTPSLIRVGGQIQMISPSAKATIAYNPWTGEELWRVRYDEHSTASRPLFDGKRLYLNTGFSQAKLIAVRADGKGDVTSTHIDWTVDKNVGSKPSQLLIGEYIFGVADKGIATCLKAANGELVWQERLGGDFSSSPVFASGRIYFFDHAGNSYVYAANGEKQQLGKNSLEIGCRASPAVIGNQLIIRTEKHLYCVGNAESKN